MKKQSVVLTILVLIASFGISQTYSNLPPNTKDTNVTCLPNGQLKQAVILIEEGKLAKQEVVYLKEKISLFEKQVINKDTIINALRDKDINWRIYSQKSEQTIANMQTQIKNLDESYKLQKKLSGKYKTQRTLFGILTGMITIYALAILP